MRTIVFAAICLFVVGLRDTQAGQLVIHNLSGTPTSCTVDGYDRDSPVKQFSIPPGDVLNLQVPKGSEMIDSVSCGANLRPRGMHIKPDGPDGTLFLNGQQARTLNVLLYSSIPTDPKVGYTPLVRALMLKYQSANPGVLLNLVLNPDVDTYNFDTLSTKVMGQAGYDVAELDTVFLTYLASYGLITPVTITGDAPIDVGKQAATIGTALYGVPSWLCSDFAFSFNAGLAKVKSLGQLQAMLNPPPNGGVPLVADFDGTWTIPAMFLQAYVQTHGVQKLAALHLGQAKRNVGPPDPVIIKMMTTSASLCDSSACINGYYHGQEDGTVERVFATGGANGDVGFSERSFFVAYYKGSSSRPLTLIPYPWGAGPRLVYSDAFVTNKKTCSTDPCLSDSATFTAWATSAGIKAYIAFSGDLPPGSPPRHLLAATQPFWRLPAVQSDPIYSQVASTLFAGTMYPYLNLFSPELQYGLLSELCPAVKAAAPAWVCKIPPPPPHKAEGAS